MAPNVAVVILHTKDFSGEDDARANPFRVCGGRLPTFLAEKTLYEESKRKNMVLW